MFCTYLHHGDPHVSCDVCISAVGSGLWILQWVQNQVFVCGAFRPSTDVVEHCMKHAKDWTQHMGSPESETDFKGLPSWLQEVILLDIQSFNPAQRAQTGTTGRKNWRSGAHRQETCLGTCFLLKV